MRYARALHDFPATTARYLISSAGRVLARSKPRHEPRSTRRGPLPARVRPRDFRSVSDVSPDVPTPWQNTHGPKASRSREPAWRWVTRTSREVGSRARFEHGHGACYPRPVTPRISRARDRSCPRASRDAPPPPRRRARSPGLTPADGLFRRSARNFGSQTSIRRQRVGSTTLDFPIFRIASNARFTLKRKKKNAESRAFHKF